MSGALRGAGSGASTERPVRYGPPNKPRRPLAPKPVLRATRPPPPLWYHRTCALAAPRFVSGGSSPMNFSGDVVLHAAPEVVWAALLDPTSLQHCLPGCQSLDPIGPDQYEATVTLGIAAVKGSYKGRVQIADKQEPTSFVL